MSDRAVIAKIGCRDGEPFVTAISVQADGHPYTTGRVLLDRYPLEANADQLLNRGNLTSLLPLATATADPAQATYAQPGAVKELLESDWLTTADPQWLYVHYKSHWTAMPVEEGAFLQLLDLIYRLTAPQIPSLDAPSFTNRVDYCRRRTPPDVRKFISAPSS